MWHMCSFLFLHIKYENLLHYSVDITEIIWHGWHSGFFFCFEFVPSIEFRTQCFLLININKQTPSLKYWFLNKVTQYDNILNYEDIRQQKHTSHVKIIDSKLINTCQVMSKALINVDMFSLITRGGSDWHSGPFSLRIKASVKYTEIRSFYKQIMFALRTYERICQRCSAWYSIIRFVRTTAINLCGALWSWSHRSIPPNEHGNGD